jgi:hypothetical protein
LLRRKVRTWPQIIQDAGGMCNSGVPWLSIQLTVSPRRPHHIALDSFQQSPFLEAIGRPQRRD